ncbi:MAG TPA: tRNA (adenosine(37)-N6)-threonylcarbamoyltransferase complex dimerization subunit type 1 TsaB [Candidatus Saccharimonadales bacterium]
MNILIIRTDKPEAEIGLYKDDEQLAYISYEAHRILAETVHRKIESMLSGVAMTWQSIEGIVCYKGPGSFTGLRIGLSMANALASSLSIPIIGSSGSDWIEDGISGLLKGEDEKLVLPEYGADPHITIQKK